MLAIWPRLARKDYLVAAMYDAVGEDCEQPESVIESHLSKLRAKLKRNGWDIENERFLGYRLVKDNTFGTASSSHSSNMEIAK